MIWYCFRQRSAKFNENELILLNTSMKKYKYVVLNKQTGKVTPKQRDEAWQSLTVEFNNDPTCSVSRSTTQLKNKWDYMKRNAKKDVAAYKRAHRQTGGGKGPAPLDDTTAILIDTARESIEGTPSKFDSDKTVSSNIIVLGNDTIDFLSPPATVTIPEEESFENTTNSYYMQPILCTTQKTNDKIDATSIKDKSDLCKSSSLIKRRKLNGKIYYNIHCISTTSNVYRKMDVINTR